MKNVFAIIFVIVCTLGLCHGKATAKFLKPVAFQNGMDQESRIIHGNVAKLAQFPHFCSLVNRKAAGTYTLCGGSLISERHILTAAHCVLNVVLSTAGCGTVDFAKPLLRITGSNSTIHPDYDASTMNNNIAIWTSPVGIIHNCEFLLINVVQRPDFKY